MRRTALVVLLIAAALGSASAIKCYTYGQDALETPAKVCTAEEVATAATSGMVKCKIEVDCSTGGGTATSCVRMHQTAGSTSVVLATCSVKGANDCATMCPGGVCTCAECTTDYCNGASGIRYAVWPILLSGLVALFAGH